MSNYRAISISELSPGSVLVTPVFDSQSVKLHDAGAMIDQQLVDRLGERGITEVFVESTAESIVKRPSLPPGVSVRDGESEAETASIDRCSGCGAVIALNPPSPNSKASTWLCKTCGAVYFGSDDGGPEREGLSRSSPDHDKAFVAPVALKVETVAPAIPAANVQRLIKSLESTEFPAAERRVHKRYRVSVPVAALPLTADFRVNGEPIQMTTADVSFGGASLIYTRFLDVPYLALDFTIAGAKSMQVVLKVLRVRSIGPVYEIGGQFVSQLSQSPK